MTKDQNLKNKQCDNSCGCNKIEAEKKDLQKTNPNLSQDSETQSHPQNEPDPTRFGDWQINGRAIDF